MAALYECQSSLIYRELLITWAMLTWNESLSTFAVAQRNQGMRKPAETKIAVRKSRLYHLTYSIHHPRESQQDQYLEHVLKNLNGNRTCVKRIRQMHPDFGSYEESRSCLSDQQNVFAEVICQINIQHSTFSRRSSSTCDGSVVFPRENKRQAIQVKPREGHLLICSFKENDGFQPNLPSVGKKEYLPVLSVRRGWMYADNRRFKSSCGQVVRSDEKGHWLCVRQKREKALIGWEGYNCDSYSTVIMEARCSQLGFS